MAQHIPIDTLDHKTIKSIARGVRNQVDFAGSLKYDELTYPEYKETPEDRVFIGHRRVPESIVFGGWATIEVHTKPRKGYGQQATNIYLVA